MGMRGLSISIRCSVLSLKILGDLRKTEAGPSLRLKNGYGQDDTVFLVRAFGDRTLALFFSRFRATGFVRTHGRLNA
jgi:hypothetical protein